MAIIATIRRNATTVTVSRLERYIRFLPQFWSVIFRPLKMRIEQLSGANFVKEGRFFDPEMLLQYCHSVRRTAMMVKASRVCEKLTRRTGLNGRQSRF